MNAGGVQPSNEVQRRLYYPILSPSIVRDLAHVQPGNAARAVRFARRWGLLGEGLQGFWEADPLVWVWGHAHGIRVVLDLLKLLGAEDIDGVEDYLNGMTVSRAAIKAQAQVKQLLKTGHYEKALTWTPTLWPKNKGYRQPSRQVGLIHSKKGEIGLTLFASGAFEDRSSLAWEVICAIVNQNLVGGVFRQLEPVHRQTKPTIRYWWDSLISVVYWHLATLVTVQRVRECLFCKALFEVTDERQRFCPADFGEKRSRCMNAFYQRQFREKGRAQAKPTKLQGEES